LGTRGAVAGMLHAVFLLLLIAAPLASYIALAALAAVLTVVAWNMAEKRGPRAATPWCCSPPSCR
jgi:sulfate permease, SulP family